MIEVVLLGGFICVIFAPFFQQNKHGRFSLKFKNSNITKNKNDSNQLLSYPDILKN